MRSCDGHRLGQDLTFDGFRLADPVGRLRGNLFHHIHPFNNFAEGREPLGIRLGAAVNIKHGRIPGADEELRNAVTAGEDVAGQGYRPVDVLDAGVIRGVDRRPVLGL